MESTIKLDSGFRALLDATEDVVAVADGKSGHFVAINRGFSKLFNYSLQNLNNIDLGKFYGISDKSDNSTIFNTNSNFEKYICNVKVKDGGSLAIELSCTTIQQNNQDYFLLRHKMLFQDTNRLVASGILSLEQRFDESEAKWQAISENSPDHIMMIDTNGIILSINHTVPNLTVEQVVGKSCYQFTAPEQIPLLKEMYAKATNSGKPIQFDTDYQAGDTTIYFDNRVWPVFRGKKVVALLVTSRDITDRFKTLKQLEKSQQHLHLALKAGKTGTWDWDLITNDVTWSEGVEDIFGMAPNSFQGTYEAYRNIIHPDDLPIVESAIERTFNDAVPYYVKHRFITSDGSIHWLNSQGEVYRNKQGTPIRMIGTVQDITERKLAEDALMESQQKLAMHLQHTPLGVIDWNPNLEIIEWNPAAEKIFGYSRNEALGKSPFGLIVSETIKPQLEEVWKALVSNEGGYKKTNENITKNNRQIICEWYNTPLVDDTGKVIGVSSLVQDITDRIRVQEELEKHRLHLEELVKSRTEQIHEQALVIDQVHDSVVSTDFNGIVKSWNKGAEKMFGYSATQAIGKNISFIYPIDQHDFLFNEILPKLKEKGELETEVEVLRKNGERFFALLSLSIKHDLNGNPSGLIGYTIDITDRKKSEYKILRQQKALEAANKELEAFSYSVSHDLRSPLRAIDGFSAALLEDYYDLLDDNGKHYFQRIRRSAQRMADLIDDLLQLSRVGRLQIKKEPVNLSLLALDIVQKYKFENPERDVDIEIEENMNVKGDPSLLHVALDNLISNAWKYTAKTPSAKIQLYRTKLNGTFTYCIKDNGVGFDMTYVNKLFGAFQRLHTSDDFSGNGIGLATVSRIITRHGGGIWAEGDVNKGATFFFTLSEHELN